MKTIVCSSCGASNGESSTYCGSCGGRLRSATVPGPLLPERQPQVTPPNGAISIGDPLVGQVIADRYRILELIGRGGMGVVYKVEHVGMGKLMAMKLLHGELSRDKEIVKRFKREAQAASLLKHINTVSIFDFGRADGLMYLVMEYIDGIDLGRMVRSQGPLPVTRVATLIVQTCGSLAEAHECGIVHRDLKPENVLVSKTRDQHDFVKVLDFGLAKLRESEHQVEITSQGSLIGTPYYMAPEQIRGESVDARTDIYAVGAMMYKTISGSPPFAASTPVGVLTRHLTEPVVPLCERFPELGLPGAVDDIVLRAMAKKPADRYQKADELRDALVAFLRQEGVEFSSADGWRPPTGQTPRSSQVALPAGEAIAVGRTGDRVIKVATREDVDRYERGIRRGRYGWLLVLLVIVIIAASLGAWAWRKRERILASETEIEPNEMPSQAQQLLDGQPVTGYLGRRFSVTESDRDWFRFVNPGGATSVLAAEVTGIPNMDVVLELVLKGDSQRLYMADEARVGGGEAISGLRVTGTEFYLLIRELWVDGQRPTENVSDPYEIRYTLTKPGPGIEMEPNDAIEHANALPLGITVRGVLSGRRDLDYYCLDGATQGRVADAHIGGAPEVDLTLRVIDRARSESRIIDQGGVGAGEEATGIPLVTGAPSPCFEVGWRQNGDVPQGNQWKLYGLTITAR